MCRPASPWTLGQMSTCAHSEQSAPVQPAGQLQVAQCSVSELFTAFRMPPCWHCGSLQVVTASVMKIADVASRELAEAEYHNDLLQLFEAIKTGAGDLPFVNTVFAHLVHVLSNSWGQVVQKRLSCMI